MDASARSKSTLTMAHSLRQTDLNYVAVPDEGNVVILFTWVYDVFTGYDESVESPRKMGYRSLVR
jgi:hypothetical protein